MPRIIIATAITALLAAPAIARQPFALDHNGILWQAQPSPDGLLITGQRDGQEVARGFVPTAPIGGLNIVDSHVEVAVDAAGSEAVVVWQRSWGRNLSEVLLARWSASGAGTVMRLSGPLANAARHPALKVQQVKWREVDGEDPEIVHSRQETLVHVVWWEDSMWGSGARYAWLSLATPATEQKPPIALVLEQLAGEGDQEECEAPLEPEIREYPLFVAGPGPDSFGLLYASGSCRLSLWRIGSDVVIPPTFGGEDPGVSAQRRRARPIFGERGDIPAPPVPLPAARAVTGNGLLLYTLDDERRQVSFSLLNGGSWSVPRTVFLSKHVTPQHLLPILEALAY